jgi:hypothetical protein
MIRIGTLLLLLSAGHFLPGCSGEQAYRAGQGWQQNQCMRLPDKAEYDRCMANASMSHDTYKRETGK